MNLFERILTALGLRKKRPRLDCPARYRAQVQTALASAEAKLGLTWKGERLTVLGKPATHRAGWMWCGRTPDGRPCGAYAIGSPKRQTGALKGTGT